ncbi:MAG TPA: hypothetical protein DEP36_12520 [Gammaproteobacteria bacterium]|nr:hypothetical protein [Candidatus Competibacteraceae bacterium]MCP5134302.1 hypothetical protein [Gammaproteobacteria bacterium]HCB14375.1 hypothetical protein [Gammaproteobacteria bacterium]HPF58211.1 hypothetical protein [Candidatus Competibacteraceae bacterium]HRF45689.1 hypothetical protein [Candidatus Competibacteraceae bacterium]
MKYIAGTIADVMDDGTIATLILDTGEHKHHLQADSHLLSEALTALYGEDCIGKPVAVECNGPMLTSIEIPGAAPDYAI